MLAPSRLLFNGLDTIEEVESIRVQPQNIAHFSLPQEVLNYIPDANEVVTSFSNGEKERKIYSNVELNQVEQRQLQELQAEARRHGRKFLPWIAASVMRYVTRARGDPTKALEQMQATQDWRSAFFRDGPICDESIAADLQHGVVYIAARDRSLRPTLIIRPARIPATWLKSSALGKKLLRVLVFSMEYMVRYMCLPGHVETGIIIMDLGGINRAHVPLGALRELITILSQHYLYRMHRFYLCNVPTFIRRMRPILMKMLTERQKQKIVLVGNPEEIRQDFALHHLETDLGGDRPLVTQFFPFPLEAGPFDGNCRGGANAVAIPNIHEAITEAGFRGRVWDPACSAEQNAQIEFSDTARCTFKQHCLALPCLKVDDVDNQREQLATETDSSAKDVKPISSATTEDGSVGSAEDHYQQSDAVSVLAENDPVEDFEISPAPGFLWSMCMPSRNLDRKANPP